MCKKEEICISIIVPVYNVEQYLKQCVESLIHQTYRNLQILLIDDGSTDRSAGICDDYASKDERVIVIHKANGGLSSARQAGVQAAMGQYIMIVDSDDWIELETCQRCVEVVRKEQTDCVMFGYVREHFKASIENPLFEKDFYYDKSEAEEKIHRRLIGMNDKELCQPQKIDNFSSVCMKLYRTEIAKKGRIVSERIVGTSEDTVFNIYALDKCSVSYINECFYHYRKTNTNSITYKHKEGLPEKWDILYQIIEEYIESTNKKEQYHPLFLNRVACGMIGLGLNEVSADKGILDKVRQIRKVLLRPLYKEAFRKLNIKYCPIHWKVFFLLCKTRFAFGLTCLLLIINDMRYKVNK